MLPIVVAIGLTIATVAGFITWSTTRTDEHALARQTRLLEQALADQIATVPTTQSEFAISDGAIAAVETGDLDWLNENIGAVAFDYAGQSRVFIIDGAGEPVYAMRDGGQVPPRRLKPSALPSPR